MAVCTAIDPSLVAGKDDNAPRKLPIGVRTALAIKTSCGRLPFPKLRAALQDMHRRSVGATSLLLLQTDKVDAMFFSYSQQTTLPFQAVHTICKVLRICLQEYEVYAGHLLDPFLQKLCKAIQAAAC